MRIKKKKKEHSIPFNMAKDSSSFLKNSLGFPSLFLGSTLCNEIILLLSDLKRDKRYVNLKKKKKYT